MIPFTQELYIYAAVISDWICGNYDFGYCIIGYGNAFEATGNFIKNELRKEILPMSIFEIKDVSYSYEKNRNVLTSVNAVFETGKIYAILGQSGSGKTTLLSLLGGLDAPQKGGILFDGKDVES